ncbi:MAG: hypothetical protein ACKV2T_22825 [Kofleriaceae bacterium]
MPIFTPAQSDFTVAREPPASVVELPEEAKVVELPKAELLTNEASARSVKWVYIFTAVVLFALVVLTVVGPHIPAGE